MNSQKSAHKKEKKNPTNPQTRNLKKHPPLPHVSLAFPMLSGRTCITVVDGAYQIQNLPLAFGLWARNLNFPKKVIFKGIQNR
jgi:hypothetical protein